MARYAAGSQQGLAQGIFQVGGQAGGALGPVFAALIIVPWGQPSLAWFAILALVASVFLIWIGSKQQKISIEFLNMMLMNYFDKVQRSFRLLIRTKLFHPYSSKKIVVFIFNASASSPRIHCFEKSI